MHGTVDGTATYNGKEQKEIEAANLAHTFTIHQYPEGGQPDFFVSVPMLAVPEQREERGQRLPEAAGDHVLVHHRRAGRVHLELRGPVR